MTTNLRTIQLTKRDSPLVEEAFALAERHRDLVDYSARESFTQAASEGMLFAAVGEGPDSGRLLGYAMAFPSGKVCLLHQILVAETERGQGIGTRLLEAVALWAGERSLPLGVLLSEGQTRLGCWLRWGFSTAGPGTDVTTYTGRRYVRLERETAPDLFTRGPVVDHIKRLPALIDPSLFEELALCPALEAETELRVLASGRFRRQFEVYLRGETGEEMARGHTRDPRGRTAIAREKRIHALAFYERLPGGGLDLEAYRARATRVLLETDDKPLDVPHEELAFCAAAGLPLFLTLNEALLQREDALYRELGVTVATPTEALLALAILLREGEYSPIRLQPEFLRGQLLPEEIPHTLADKFIATEFGETKETFLRKLDRFRDSVQPGACRRLIIGPVDPATVSEETPPLAEGLQALVVLLRNSWEILRVPLWRLPAHPARPTFARQMLADLVQDALAENRKILLIQDGFLHPDMVAAMEECGFLPAGADSWVRLLLPGGRKVKAWSTELRDLPDLDPVLSPAVNLLQGYLTPKATGIPKEDFLALERALAPGRVLGAEIPTYLAEMKPGWAMRVFDEDLAEVDLFEGVHRSKLRPREAVFFLPATGDAPKALPGRVVWHVCSRSNGGYVRAISNLVSVEVDTAENLYRKYRRLGYFTERDVQALAGSGTSRKAAASAALGEACAWLFTDTWLLPRALPWAEAHALLEETEHRTQFGTVAPLSHEGFQELLHAGSYPLPVEENTDHLLLWD